MKHVEIWLGKGQKTIGSRWQRGTVSIFDSYRFESKTYHNMEYHFKSIDTWLKGFCRSVCPDHPWRLKRPIEITEKSIFSSGNKKKSKTKEELSVTGKSLQKQNQKPSGKKTNKIGSQKSGLKK